MPSGSGALKRERQQYSAWKKAQTLIALGANRGNVQKTAEEQGVPRTTVTAWAKGTGIDDEVRRLVRLASVELVELVEEQARMLFLGITQEKIAEASVRDLAVAGAVLVDKAQVLRGLPDRISGSVRMTDEERVQRTVILLEQGLARVDAGENRAGEVGDDAGGAGGARPLALPG